MWKKNERTARMAGPRSRPQVVNRRRSTRNESPGGTRRVAGRNALSSAPEKKREPAAPIVPRRVRPPESAEVLEARAKWKELTSQLSSRDGKPYYPDRTYAEGDVLLHKRHGMGVVESVVHEHAIMVLFRDVREVIEMAQTPTR